MTAASEILSNPRQSTGGTPRFPGLRFLITIILLTYGVVAGFIFLKGWSLNNWIIAGRTRAFLDVADGLMKWNFTGLEVKAFWGVSIATALVEQLTGMSSANALLGICLFCGVASIFLVYELFGWQVAALATFISGSWVKHVLLGGTEPLFVFLILLAVWLLRAERVVPCAVIAALACTVRPVGITFAAALVANLLYSRRTTEAVRCCLAMGAIGLAYMALLYAATGDPLSNVHGYRGDWSGELPIGIPVFAIFRHAPRLPMGAWIKDLGFVFLTFLCLYQTRSRLLTESLQLSGRVEAWFVILFAAFHLSYNSPYGLSEYPRFIVPLMPWLAASLNKSIPMGKVALLLAAGVLTTYNAFTLG